MLTREEGDDHVGVAIDIESLPVKADGCVLALLFVEYSPHVLVREPGRALIPFVVLPFLLVFGDPGHGAVAVDNSMRALPLRHWSICSIVRSCASFMLITIFRMINPFRPSPTSSFRLMFEWKHAACSGSYHFGQGCKFSLHRL
ncbi:hypothetical protein E4Q23_13595 [Candidatus Accumulibacter phosphatis]|uniref:Uncharacterized protein n=1 Tax=Candidatus Accumulibacter phosphatis TaxID=327160 RepID=A0ABX1TZ38_9PROT|nr:hypothetical protein [Candidatus Accumulibacter phosphatis]NMQ28700.1 hypothetical protein [Candidatus Accumulibacter phosphatis]